MTDVRLSRLAVEPLLQTDPDIHVSRFGVEVLVQGASLRASRFGVEVLVKEAPWLFASSQGLTLVGDADLTVEAGETVEGHVNGYTRVRGNLQVLKKLSAVGSTTVRAQLRTTLFDDLYAATSGFTTASAYLDPFPTPDWPIPYPLWIDGNIYQNLAGLSQGATRVGGAPGQSTPIEVVPPVSSTGSTAVSGTLSSGTGFDSASSTGSTTVSGALWANVTVSLSGSSQGRTVVSGWALDGRPKFGTGAYYLYQYMNVGIQPKTHFNPARYLYQYMNIGVGFYPLDSIADPDSWWNLWRPDGPWATFVSQTFPDGDATSDFAAYLYQYLNVIDLDKPDGWVTIGSTPRTIPPTWKAKPPGWKRTRR
jgi:hypothetical protein